ncbi:hypothetical protein I552_10267 [Mycobacterium xenopi 3993]|nr:hypothetical protein I552_10267 [Mycobacterium xenopi 3993]
MTRWTRHRRRPRRTDGAQLADEYVANHSAEFAAFPSMTVQQLVEAVDVFRAANMLEDQWRVETWLLHRFEPQNIGGQHSPSPRPGANRKGSPICQKRSP